LSRQSQGRGDKRRLSRYVLTGPEANEAMNAINRDALFSKIAELSDERVAQINDFVDFIREKQADGDLKRDFLLASEPAFARVWDNEEDDIYNDV